ncbi:N-6 DNA methylase [Nodosilinea sp. LEGE 07298]|uniref:membrane protein insertion efficiency factor YidD n=1 Tax=Nodosilinea sp. LEGE 07298 TaxID=2777970 RepID=UPI00187E8EF2|nr:membrane protein insertion efficiency factor YidD [Nodosilinea sp. LEGE 07298]MBE9111211.1 N-6 DNA methylase [Nodosilinea sp. LEGE 07298]
MTAYTFESVATQAAIASLNVYRTHISPRKGFSCPHGVLYGESCSDHIKHLLIEQNLSAAIRMAPQQFRNCQLAAQTLQSRQAQGGCFIIPCCIPIPI